MRFYRIKKQAATMCLWAIFLYGHAQKPVSFDVRTDNRPIIAKPEVVRDSNTVTGSVYGEGSLGALTLKDRVGTVGKMDNKFYDYNSGLKLSFPLVKDKVWFFGNEQLSGNRVPTQYNIGKEETEHILSRDDAQVITQLLQQRYGEEFDAGTADVYSPYRNDQIFFNGIDWKINDKNKVTLFNYTQLSNGTRLQRDRQVFRFGNMAYRQKDQTIETGVDWQFTFNDAWHGNVTAGYTVQNNRRDPISNPNLPQVQIAGRTPGSMILLGTDREADIYDSRQKIWNVEANFNWTIGRHELLIGTKNEFDNVKFAYLSGWNGRIDYLSIDDFLNSNPYRVRGTYSYINNDRQYILDNGSNFKLNRFNLYIQDDIQAYDNLRLTLGLRASMFHLPEKPSLSEKVKDVWADPHFGRTYSYTPVNRITNDFLNKIDFSPRFEFEYDAFRDGSMILHGGAGIFTGELPLSWLAYAYRHTGDLYGDFSQRADEEPFLPGLDPLKPGENGITDYIASTGVIIDNPNSGTTELDLVDNNFVMPKFFKTSIGADYKTNGWEFGLNFLYQKTMKDVFFQQVNTSDDPYWYGFDYEHKQPLYKGKVDPRFSSIYIMTNTEKGHKYAINMHVSKDFSSGWNFHADYTVGEEKDIKAGLESSMEANRQLTPALIPNNPELGYSNNDIRHRINAGVGYTVKWANGSKTSASLSFRANSGSPFTYGIVNHTLQGNSQYVSLVYVPERTEAHMFFKDNGEQTAQQQAEALNAFIEGDDYLKKRRGKFTERNAVRTPWNVKADLHLSHEIVTNHDKMQSVTFFADVINLTNLLSNKWGRQYFASDIFNATSSVGLTPILPFGEQNSNTYPVFTFGDSGKPYSIDYFESRARLQMGVKYSF